MFPWADVVLNMLQHGIKAGLNIVSQTAEQLSK
jgi:hypothetical protein